MTMDVTGGATGSKMALRRFVMRAAGGFRGRREGEMFARELIGCFSGGEVPEEVAFGHTFAVVDAGKRGTRSVSAHWAARRVVVEVVERDLMLDLAWSELLRVCLQMPVEPQYVLLSNQRDVRLYDLAFDRAAPRLTISLDELPKYSEAFPFFEPIWTPGATPKIINVDKVSKEVADLVARVYRTLKAQNPERGEDVIRFTLQCIIAMFSEDIGLLPKEYFTTLLYRAAEEGNAAEKLAELFRQMATPPSSAAKNESGIPYFNGGLFTAPVTLELGKAPLEALTKASEANWTFVDPHIFGSVFQGIMGSAERHASGAHYTAREDIMSVVGPTIVEPWRERISAAKSLKELREVLTDLTKYKVLDPACGSGNFLYVAFRELYKLETEVLCRAYEFESVQKNSKISWSSGIRTTNFFGIDINPFAVELAKTTLNIAKKIAFDERRATVTEMYGQGFLEVDPSLPLDNLDENVRCADALFTDWPTVDAIVGNPPFLGGSLIRNEMGGDYLERLQSTFGTGGGDLCAFWFRKAHGHLGDHARAGLVATSAIRFGLACETSLEFIVANGGTIVDAVSSQPWPGDAAVNVSVINWVKGDSRQRATLRIGSHVYHPAKIQSHLQLHADVSEAVELDYPSTLLTEGIKFGSEAFELPDQLLPQALAEGSARRTVSAGDVLSGRFAEQPKHAIWLADHATEASARDGAPAAFAFLKEHFFRHVAQQAGSASSAGIWKQWVKRWWQPWAPRNAFRQATASYHRVVATGRVQSRPVFVLLSTRYIPTDTFVVFGYADDYSFGIIQSSLHWAWTKAKGGRLTDRIRYTTDVWKTFPWPQEPSLAEVVAVARAARALRATRDQLMDQNGWSLRALYQSAEVAGPHPLKDAQAALDAAVEAAYGKPPDQEATEFLLEMNLALAEDETAGRTIQGPGLPKGLEPKDSRWFSTDCIEPPPLPGAEAAS